MNIEISIPKGFMNVGVSVDNNLIADTNDSQNWDTLILPLPKPNGKWSIKSIDGKKVSLIDTVPSVKTWEECASLFQKLSIGYKMMVQHKVIDLVDGKCGINELHNELSLRVLEEKELASGDREKPTRTKVRPLSIKDIEEEEIVRYWEHIGKGYKNRGLKYWRSEILDMFNPILKNFEVLRNGVWLPVEVRINA